MDFEGRINRVVLKSPIDQLPERITALAFDLGTELDCILVECHGRLVTFARTVVALLTEEQQDTLFSRLGVEAGGTAEERLRRYLEQVEYKT